MAFSLWPRILLTKEALCGEQMWQFLVETVVGGHIDHIVPADVTGWSWPDVRDRVTGAANPLVAVMSLVLRLSNGFSHGGLICPHPMSHQGHSTKVL